MLSAALARGAASAGVASAGVASAGVASAGAAEASGAAGCVGGVATTGRGDLRTRWRLPAAVRLRARLAIDPLRISTDVRDAVAAALRQTFSFANRSFAEPVHSSDVIAVMQAPKADTDTEPETQPT